MTLSTVISSITSFNRIEDSVNYFLFRDNLPAFNSVNDYSEFKQKIFLDFPNAQEVIVAGSGNWGYSFNPDKAFREFSTYSDIDVAIISEDNFMNLWSITREYHRNSFYSIPLEHKNNLRRNGENIYSGFITAKWFPKWHKERILYDELTNKYSDKLVLYRVVNIMFFRNNIELVDYYKRSFRTAVYNFNH